MLNMKNKIAEDHEGFRQKWRNDRDGFLSRIITVETECESLKNNLEYVKKVLQQQKFFGGGFASVSIGPGGHIQTAEGSIENSVFAT